MEINDSSERGLQNLAFHFSTPFVEGTRVLYVSFNIYLHNIPSWGKL